MNPHQRRKARRQRARSSPRKNWEPTIQLFYDGKLIGTVQSVSIDDRFPPTGPTIAELIRDGHLPHPTHQGKA